MNPDFPLTQRTNGVSGKLVIPLNYYRVRDVTIERQK